MKPKILPENINLVDILQKADNLDSFNKEHNYSVEEYLDDWDWFAPRENPRVRYEIARIKNPNIIEPYMKLGELFISDKNYTEAINIYKDGIKNTFDNFLLLYLLGVCHFNFSELEIAKDYFSQAIDKENKFSLNYEYLSIIYYLQNDINNSLQFYEKYVDIELYNRKYNNDYFTHKLQMERNVGNQILNNYKLFIAKAYLNINKIFKAEKLYESLQLEGVNDDYLNLQLGIYYSQNKKYLDKGLYLLEKVKSSNPNCALAYYYIGLIYYQKEFYNELFNYFDRFFELQPEGIDLIEQIPIDKLSITNQAIVFFEKVNKKYNSPIIFDKLISLYLKSFKANRKKEDVDKINELFNKCMKLGYSSKYIDKETIELISF